jgi:hypothetical protein
MMTFSKPKHIVFQLLLSINNTVIAFYLDTKKQGRGWRQPAYRRPADRIVSKQNASPVYRLYEGVCDGNLMY